MSSLFGGSKTTTTNDPWAAQQPYIKDAFSQAQDLYNSKQGTPYYQGELHAGLDPMTQQGIGDVGGYVNGAGASTASGVAGTGSSLMGATPDYLKALGAFGASASADPTQSNIASAGAYANNPYLNGQIDAASRDVTRNLTENTLPGVDRAATATGGINSTRAGIASGIAMRGAQDQIGDIASTMRGNAYNSGLSLAEQARQANLGAQGQSAGLYGSAVNSGVGAAETGNAMTMGNLDSLIKSGQISQADAQALDDANFSRWQGDDTRQQDLLNNYYNIIGAKSFGGTSTQVSKSSPGILGAYLALVSAGAGIAKSAGGA